MSSVGGIRSPSGMPGSSGGTGSAKLPPLLWRLAGGGLRLGIDQQRRNVRGGTATSPIASCGTNTAPFGMTMCVPSGMSITRSRPTTWISESATPAGRLTMPWAAAVATWPIRSSACSGSVRPARRPACSRRRPGRRPACRDCARNCNCPAHPSTGRRIGRWPGSCRRFRWSRRRRHEPRRSRRAQRLAVGAGGAGQRSRAGDGVAARRAVASRGKRIHVGTGDRPGVSSIRASLGSVVVGHVFHLCVVRPAVAPRVRLESRLRMTRGRVRL